MNLKHLKWLADFVWVVSLVIAIEGLRRLHSLGQPLSRLVGEAIFAAAVFTLLVWTLKPRHG